MPTVQLGRDTVQWRHEETKTDPTSWSRGKPDIPHGHVYTQPPSVVHPHWISWRERQQRVRPTEAQRVLGKKKKC